MIVNWERYKWLQSLSNSTLINYYWKNGKTEVHKKQRWRFVGNLNGRPLSGVKWSGARAAAAVTRATYQTEIRNIFYSIKHYVERDLL